MDAAHPSAEVPITQERVVVVGAGPAGCTVALLLADLGVPVTLLERHPAPHPLPRAVHLDDEVTRILHRIGVVDDFLAASRPGSGLRLLDAGHRVMAEFPRRQQPGRHGFPQANMFHQPDLEDLMFARVQAHPLIEFHRSVEVVGVDGVGEPFGAAPVRVRTRAADDTAAPGRTFTGAVVLGCDGANSIVRDAVGVTMEDLGFTERWLVVDVRTDRDLDTYEGVEQVCDPARAATFMQVTGDRYRWEFQLRDGEQESDLTGSSSLGALLRPWTGRSTLDGLEVTRSATYTFRARIASRFRVGRVFLLGDAAHLTPPFIGQGLAAGLRDADNLAWKLADVLGGRAEASLLDSYQAERRPHARALVKRAVAVGWAMTGGQDRAAAVRRVVLSVVVRSGRVRDLLGNPCTPRLRTGALQTVRGRIRTPRALAVGALIANPAVQLADGSRVRLDDVIGGRSVVLTAREPEPALVDRCATEGLLLVRLRSGLPGATGAGPGRAVRPGTAATADPGPVELWPAPGDSRELDLLTADPGLAVLVRPDRVIAAVGTGTVLPQAPWAVRPRRAVGV